jgi:hypothetical protein
MTTFFRDTTRAKQFVTVLLVPLSASIKEAEEFG